MKTIITAILIAFSFSSIASQDMDVLEALKSLFPAGTYSGMTPDQKEFCSLEVVFADDRAELTAEVVGQEIHRTITAGSVYRFRPGTRAFLSSDLVSTFRTLSVNDNHIYVVMAEPAANGRESKIECIIQTHR